MSVESFDYVKPRLWVRVPCSSNFFNLFGQHHCIGIETRQSYLPSPTLTEFPTSKFGMIHDRKEGLSTEKGPVGGLEHTNTFFTSVDRVSRPTKLLTIIVNDTEIQFRSCHSL